MAFTAGASVSIIDPGTEHTLNKRSMNAHASHSNCLLNPNSQQRGYSLELSKLIPFTDKWTWAKFVFYSLSCDLSLPTGRLTCFTFFSSPLSSVSWVLLFSFIRKKSFFSFLHFCVTLIPLYCWPFLIALAYKGPFLSAAGKTWFSIIGMLLNQLAGKKGSAYYRGRETSIYPCGEPQSTCHKTCIPVA